MNRTLEQLRVGPTVLDNALGLLNHQHCIYQTEQNASVPDKLNTSRTLYPRHGISGVGHFIAKLFNDSAVGPYLSHKRRSMSYQSATDITLPIHSDKQHTVITSRSQTFVCESFSMLKH